MKVRNLAWVLAAAPTALVGCDRGSGAEGPAASDAGHAAMPTNRVDIPPSVRRNLGITFVPVEQRRVEQTLRVPGRFEYTPTARREYRTMLPGRIELRVDQYQAVDPGRVLYEIDSPEWRSLQQSISDTEAAIERHATRVASFKPLRAAHRHHEEQLEEVIRIRRERVRQLERVAEAGGGRRADLSAARGALSSAEAELAEVLEKEAALGADEAAARSELSAAKARRDFLLETASALVRVPVSALVEAVDTEQGKRPRWRTIGRIPVRAEEQGVIESVGLTSGAWATEESMVLTVVRPDRLRFHAVGLQSDLGRLRDGLPARIVPPTVTREADRVPLDDTMPGTLRLGLSGDPDDRTVDLFVVPDALASWARAGVSAQLEIVTDTTARPVLAVPRAAIQRDGLLPVLFRRDPSDPNRAIRMEADLGLDDGRWVVVRSGLVAGDEIVLDGAFQLMLATSSDGSMQKGGHFHSDGTFHADDAH